MDAGNSSPPVATWMSADAATPRLELLASAVAGRSISLARTRHGVHTDGATIYLGTDVDEHSRQAHWAVLAQASLLAVGSLDNRAMRRLVRSAPDASRRFLGLEVVRACAELSDVLPAGFRTAVAAYARTVGVTGSIDESLARALARVHTDDPPHWFGNLRPHASLRAATKDGAPPSDGDIRQALREAMQQDEDDEDDSGERSKFLEMMSSPLSNPIGAALRRGLKSRSSVGGGNAGAGITRAQLSSGRRSQHARAVSAHLPPSRVEMGGRSVHGATYPEWDHRAGHYREAWCTVGDFDPLLRPEVTVPALSVEPRLLREFSRLGLTWRPHDAEALGDELDLTALVDHRVSASAGFESEPRVYRAERRTAVELGVLVLLDATSSASERSHGRVVFDEQRTLALDLTSALDRLGVRVGTYAFYSRGRSNVRMLRCKAFDERWGLAAQRRLCSIDPTGFTRLGAAIRHATRHLATQAGTQRRLLIVIGDGAAYDDDYEGRYAVEDSRRSVDEARDHAVGCVGIATRPGTEGASIWPADAYREVTTTAELAPHVRDLFGLALRRAGSGGYNNYPGR